MTKRSTMGLAAAALLFGTLACAGGMAREDDAGAAVQDTTEAQNPEGYRGMEQDTTQVPSDVEPTPTDTFLQEQGTGVPADTAGYSGLEHPDTTGMTPDTTGMTPDTSGMAPDAGVIDTTGGMGVDTSGMSGMSDTTAQQ
jgi:hypothetical protein